MGSKLDKVIIYLKCILQTRYLRVKRRERKLCVYKVVGNNGGKVKFKQKFLHCTADIKCKKIFLK